MKATLAFGAWIACSQMGSPNRGATAFVAPYIPRRLNLRTGRVIGSRDTTSCRISRASTVVCMAQEEGTSFKNIAVASVLLVATFGASVLPFLSAGPETGSASKTVRVVQEDGTEIIKGSLTAMSRAEIQKKLSQLPVFFLRESNGAVHLKNGEGLFFMSPEDAKAKLAALTNSENIRVAATTLDDVFFPLVLKKGANAKPVGAETSGISDTSAKYHLVARSEQLEKASKLQETLVEIQKDDVPVWIADTLAFQGVGRIKIPLFTNYSDLETSWERLKASGSKSAAAPRVQVTTIAEVVRKMEKGGGDNRMLEFFADMEAIDQAEKLF
ncbi:unnamed protein product [Choristocarpus tenellus]